ncbi:MAG: TIGR03960 family B12-binding radical SAM protein [Candidatus Eisenbacteria bacterium]|nr:TIGR03960 family B12-binding radical SAM protein [Candidatus Eisenbacteria bacterium]
MLDIRPEALRETIDRILPLVTKPSRYTGNEFHVHRKDPASVSAQWLLIFADLYEIGMSHWGLKILYDILNNRPDTLAERAYAPWIDMEARMRRESVPLFSLETRRPARSFDLIGFSLQYEMTCTNILTCLDLAGIPLWSRERGEADPLVIGGGPGVANPEPLADFFDLFLIGDGEEAVHAISDVVTGTKVLPRDQRLKALARIDGVYVPSLYEERRGADGSLLGIAPTCPEAPARPARTFLRDLETAPYPLKPIVPLQEVIQDRLNIEVLRGCTQGCRFCQAGYFYRPLRERSPRRVLEIAEAALRSGGWDGLSLVSLSTADYTQLETLAEALNRRFAGEKVSISLPSLRADSFGVAIADKIREVKRTGFTFAPEAGSERLRRAINKQISDADFFDAARIAYSRGWRLIKVYMMVGLPTETWEDVEGIVRFADGIRRIGREFGPSCKVNVSVGAFVPKSHTPFQWDPFEDPALLRAKIDHLRRGISNRWSRVKWHDVGTSHIEAILSRGDRRLARAIHRAWEMGARFDGWDELFSHERWLRALEETGLAAEMFTRRLDLDEVLPWDHIDIGVRKEFLVRERHRTDDMEMTADCRHGNCAACGMPGMPDDTRLTPEMTPESIQRLLQAASVEAARRSSTGVVWPVRIRFAKSGAARFLSHLETASILERAFRMAGVPIAHTLGHSPHPRFHFGPPLPVGISGGSELFDADLEVPWQALHQRRLNENLPGGFEIIEGKPLPVAGGVRRVSLAAEAKLGRYEIDLSHMDRRERSRVTGLIASFLASSEWLVKKTKDGIPDPIPSGGGEDRVNDRPIREPEGRQASPRVPDGERIVDLKKACVSLAWEEGTGRMECVLRLLDPEGHTANPARVLSGIFGLDAEGRAPVRAARVAILRGDGTPI